MNDPKTRFFLLGAAVIVVGVILGTAAVAETRAANAGLACRWHWR